MMAPEYFHCLKVKKKKKKIYGKSFMANSPIYKPVYNIK